jgi:hypothetical protein
MSNLSAAKLCHASLHILENITLHGYHTKISVKKNLWKITELFFITFRNIISKKKIGILFAVLQHSTHTYYS